MTFKKSLLATAIIAAFSSAAFASTPNPCCFCPHAYIGVEGGYSISNNAHIMPEFDFSGATKNFAPPGNTDWGRDIGSSEIWGAALGYQLNPNVGVQLTYDSRNQYKWRVPAITTEALDATTTGIAIPPAAELYRADLKSQTLFVDLKLAPSVCWGGLVPYVKGGIGASRNRFGTLHDTDIPITAGASPAFDDSLDRKSRTKFAWNLGAGVDYFINHNLAFNFAYRCVDVNKFVSGTFLSATPSAVVTPFRSDHVILQEVLAGLTYHFG